MKHPRTVKRFKYTEPPELHSRLWTDALPMAVGSPDNPLIDEYYWDQMKLLQEKRLKELQRR